MPEGPNMLVGRARRWAPFLGALLLLIGCKYDRAVPVALRSGNTSFVDGVDPPRCPSVAPTGLKTSGEACACDIQCETATCVGGICCSGPT